jgi:hypothetical protein
MMNFTRQCSDAVVDVEGVGDKVWDGTVEASKAIRYLLMENARAGDRSTASREDHW